MKLSFFRDLAHLYEDANDYFMVTWHLFCLAGLAMAMMYRFNWIFFLCTATLRRLSSYALFSEHEWIFEVEDVG